jgi:hypothetical protein
MPILFIIKCQEEKYYLGLSNSFVAIFFKHLVNLENVMWMNIYKPIELLYIQHFLNTEQLNSCVLHYMYIYGIENVRGGDYSNIILTTTQYDTIHNSFNIYVSD